MRNNNNHIQFFLTAREMEILRWLANEKGTTPNIWVKHVMKQFIKNQKRRYEAENTKEQIL